MILEYQYSNTIYRDNAVTSVVGAGNKVSIYTEDYKDHYKYLIEDGILKRYELSSEFFRVLPIRAWRIVA